MQDALEYLGDAIGALAEAIAEAIAQGGDALSEMMDGLKDWLNDFLSDPIVLDLGGDGFQLTALANSTTFFDLDEDGLAERTGWVGAQDALLVNDINGNGAVDGIGELVGSAITDGFDALALLDDNGDGAIDAADAAFGDLLVWRDVDGNGASTAGELLTLAQANIVSLGLSYAEDGSEIAGNTVARIGGFLRGDGTSRDMASVWFALDQSVNPPTIPAGADVGDLIWLPRLAGAANIPDLTTAMYHDPALRAMVEDVVAGAVDFVTMQHFIVEAFEPILFRWTGADAAPPPGEEDKPRYIAAMEALTGQIFGALDWRDEDDFADLETAWRHVVEKFAAQFLVQAAQAPRYEALDDMAAAFAALDPESPTYLGEATAVLDAADAALTAAEPASDFLAPFGLLETDMETSEIVGDFDAFVQAFIADQPPYIGFSVGGTGAYYIFNGGIVSAVWYNWYLAHGDFLFAVAERMGIGPDYVLNVSGWNWAFENAANIEGTAGIDVLGEALSTTGMGGQTNQQRLYGHDGDDDLSGLDGVDILIGGAGNDLIRGGGASDMYVYAAGHGLDRIVEESGDDDAIYFSSELRSENLLVIRPTGTNDLHLHFGSIGQGIVLQDQLLMGDAATEHFHFVGQDGLDAGDVVSIYLETLATEGNDTIQGTAADENMVGYGGEDLLEGFEGDDRLSGHEGADALHGQNGNDHIEGGGDDDQMNGGKGHDLIIGGLDDDTMWGGGGDDTYVFNPGDGIDIIKDYLNSAGGDGGADAIQFGEGIAPGDIVVTQANTGHDLVLDIAGTDRITLSWAINYDHERIEEIRFADGTEWTEADLMALSMEANGGDDMFYGGYDANTVIGGDGNDTLDARRGDDVIVGGVGGDFVSGGGGDDTYIFNLGHGLDIIKEYLNSAGGNGGMDVLQFGEDVAAGDIEVVQASAGHDLILRIMGTADQITLKSSVNYDHERVEQIRFADGATWTYGDLMARSMLANSGNDAFYGGYDADMLDGGVGDDTLTGRAGDDSLAGGAGADSLDGASGIDWADYSAGPRVIADLQIPTDNIGEAAGDSYVSIENLKGGALADNLRGDANANRIEGGALNDVIVGRAGDDTLAGGSGFDQIAGQQGVDSFLLASADPVDYDSIVDLALDETILLDGAAYGLAPGALDPDAFVLGSGAQDAEDRIVYLESVGKLFFDPDGVGGAGRELIAIIENRPTLDAGHFTVIAQGAAPQSPAAPDSLAFDPRWRDQLDFEAPGPNAWIA